MKLMKFFAVGILFGVIMTKSQAVSWYRIYEMFRFQSFHMYGIIGSALVTGMLAVQIIKRLTLKDIVGEPIRFIPKEKSVPRYLLGGTIFGFGWAMTGACPGPMYVLLGNGFLVISVVLISAVAGTLVYGMIKNKLPH